ncbi:MAG TPA: hypothetical protein VKA13_02950 [Gammaproteobacteria bacterium]|nr:hypothetical protein [Gammaproteobacteria bacterium]
MQVSNLHYLPLTLPFFFILFGLSAILLALVQIGILRYAYVRIGIGRRYALGILFLSLLGGAGRLDRGCGPA